MGQHKARFLWSPWPPQRCQASSTLSLAAHPPTPEVWPVCHDRDVDPRKCCQLAMLIPVTWPTSNLTKKIGHAFQQLVTMGEWNEETCKGKRNSNWKKKTHHNLEASGHLLITCFKLFPSAKPPGNPNFPPTTLWTLGVHLKDLRNLLCTKPDNELGVGDWCRSGAVEKIM